MTENPPPSSDDDQLKPFVRAKPGTSMYHLNQRVDHIETYLEHRTADPAPESADDPFLPVHDMLAGNDPEPDGVDCSCQGLCPDCNPGLHPQPDQAVTHLFPDGVEPQYGGDHEPNNIVSLREKDQLQRGVIRALEQEIEHFQTRLDRVRNLSDQRAKQINRLVQEKIELRTLLDRREETMGTLTQKLDEAVTDRRTQRVQIKNAIRALVELSAPMEYETQGTLASAMHNIQAYVKQLEKQRAQLNQDAVNLRRRNEELEGTNRQLQGRVDSQNTTIDEMGIKFQSLVENYDSRRNDIARLNNVIESLHNDRNEWISQVLIDLNTLVRQLEEKDRQLEQLHHSTAGTRPEGKPKSVKPHPDRLPRVLHHLFGAVRGPDVWQKMTSDDRDHWRTMADKVRREVIEDLEGIVILADGTIRISGSANPPEKDN